MGTSNDEGTKIFNDKNYFLKIIAWFKIFGYGVSFSHSNDNMKNLFLAENE